MPPSDHEPLAGQKALVTGANSGIAEDVTIALGQKGADVVVNYVEGDAVTDVAVTRNGSEDRYSADIVVVACGALSSAPLMLRSANDKHRDGLANGSGQVGPNDMRHDQSILMALMREPNDTVFQKTLAISDFYFGSDDWDYPLGLATFRSVARRIKQGRRASVRTPRARCWTSTARPTNSTTFTSRTPASFRRSGRSIRR